MYIYIYNYTKQQANKNGKENWFIFKLCEILWRYFLGSTEMFVFFSRKTADNGSVIFKGSEIRRQLDGRNNKHIFHDKEGGF